MGSPLISRLLKGNRFVRALAYPALRVRRNMIEKREAIQRVVAANLADLLADDPKLFLAEFESSYIMDKRSDVFARIVTEKRYEPELANLCRTYIDPAKDVVDIGANIGFFTVFLAKLTQGKVLAAEPTPNALAYLKQNIELNGVADRVVIFEGAVSNSEGAIEIKTVVGKEEYSSLGAMSHPQIAQSEWETVSIEADTLDNLVNQNDLSPGLIKIDVEGMEHVVFGGVADTLRNHRPIIISELSDYLLRKNGSSSEAVIKVIKSYGYDVYDPIDPLIKPGIKDFGDIIAFPSEFKVKFA